VEAYVSTMATDYTNAMAVSALKILLAYLPREYEQGAKHPEAREKVANASTMAGMAFANAFLGLCHSMAHKLGSFHHLPHGVANALLMPEIIRYNATDAPARMGTFSQYGYPQAVKRYAEIADALGLKGDTDVDKTAAFIAAFEDLKAKIEIKARVREYGVDEQNFLDRLDDMTEQAFDDQCTGANPRYPTMAEIKAIYLKVF
jgi:acetaldehyde dehydrogenase/alcohol dehydrogenase